MTRARQSGLNRGRKTAVAISASLRSWKTQIATDFDRLAGKRARCASSRGLDSR